MPHDHGHDHVHSHEGMSPSGHPYRADQDAPLTHFQAMEIAVRELLVEKGCFTPEQIAAAVARMDARTPAAGARVVARALTDPAVKARLLENGSDAAREMGADIDALQLIAVENTAEVHNVVVCTLCSCYPRTLLGIPPDWYKQRAYRARTVIEPRRVLGEFGLTLPADVTVRVHDSTADMRYIVLPARPGGTEGWSEDRLAELVTRDSMIGTGLALCPEGAA